MVDRFLLLSIWTQENAKTAAAGRIQSAIDVKILAIVLSVSVKVHRKTSVAKAQEFFGASAGAALT